MKSCTILPSYPWKVVAVKSRVIMGQFTDRKAADKYVKELARLGANPMEVAYYTGTDDHVYTETDK